MDTFEKMYSVKEVAGLLGVSRDSVARLIRRGHLRAVRFPRMGGKGGSNGGNVPSRVQDSEIKDFIRRNGGR